MNNDIKQLVAAADKMGWELIAFSKTPFLHLLQAVVYLVPGPNAVSKFATYTFNISDGGFVHGNYFEHRDDAVQHLGIRMSQYPPV